MSRILNRYIIREIAHPTLMALLTITFILLVGRIYDLINVVLQPSVSAWQVIKLLLCFLPSLILFALPMAVLVGVLIGVGRMVMDREVLAIRAAGVNLFKVFMPALIVSLLLSGSVLWLSANVVPNIFRSGIRQFAQLTLAMISSLEPGQLYDDLSSGDEEDDMDSVLYFHQRDPNGDMRNIIIKTDRDFKPKGLKNPDEYKGRRTEQIYVFAQQGKIETFKQEGEESWSNEWAEVVLTLHNGSIHYLSPEEGKEDYVVSHFDKFEKRLQRNIKLDKDVKIHTNHELREIVKNEDRGDKTRRSAHRVLIERFSMPWATFVFVLMGIPLAIWIRPSGKSWGIMIAFLMMLAYYVLAQIGLSMIKSGNPIGVGMAFLPDVLFLLVGLTLWWHTLRS